MGEAPELITAAEMRKLLRALYAGDPEGKLLSNLARGLRDPAMPLDATGRSRLNPLWLTLLLLSLAIALSFAVFTILES